jgi:hypothetical protein
MGSTFSTHTGKVINTYIILDEKPEGKRTSLRVAGWIILTLITKIQYKEGD